jgi:AmmeMemoRadiSam system protein A
MLKLDGAQRQELLCRARTAIAAVIGADEKSPPPSAVSAVRVEHSGAFVTLRVGKDLRGCIGYPESDLPLTEVVERCAVSAATSDPRFPAVSVPEWPDVEIEISVLGPIEPVTDMSEIEIGRHGLIAELGRRRGLLLPQVATEWGWDRVEFVAHTCAKAGLPKDAWRQGAKLYKFEADVFGEGG